MICCTLDLAIACRSNAGFLPAAYIVGLQPGLPVSVPILVVAEDGVTSNRYFVSLYRDLPKNTSNSAPESANAPPPAADGNGQSMLDVTVSLASDLSSPPPPSIVPVSAQAHASKISTASVLNSHEQNKIAISES